ncbi:MAG: long-chain-fatty-acid--CoA ligase [Deltaproteobacteria bacterium]|nr:MAG: long-chain-fatty-acid--CoA ligase [Deltaproteobacteria bacterium]
MPAEFLLKELSRYKIGTFADIIYRNALLYPDQEAFVYWPERITFSEFNARVNSLIHALSSMGLRKADIIGVLSWNCLEYADVYGAAMKGGFIATPFNPRLQADELAYLINYSEASTLFVGTELLAMANSLRPRLPKVENFISFESPAPDMIAHRDIIAVHSKEEPDVQVEEDDLLYIFYTSGTTGIPRGAIYTQRRKMEDTRIYAQALGVEAGDKHVMVMPLFHIGGNAHFWAFFYAGGTNIILKFFDPATTLQCIQDEKATDIHVVPTHLVAMLALSDFEKYNLGSLKRMWYAASPMPLELLKKAMNIWGPIFMQAYGQTESGPMVTFLSKQSHSVLDKPSEEQGILASCGQPCLGTHVRVVDDKENDVKPGEVGEIIVHSKQMMVEYWHKPDETREALVNGWLHTGDLGRYDEKGYIYIVDRKKDMIVSGGENIFPREIEEVIYQHPSVQEAAVLGIPDTYWVEKVHAVVVLKKGAKLTEQELIAFCKQRLASFKAPKSVEFADALPKSPAGKILKKEMREKYWSGTERRV